MTVAPEHDDWQDALTQGFSILLGRSLDEVGPDASYAAFYDCADLSLDLFERGFDVEVLTSGEIIHPPFPTIPVLGELLAGWDSIAPQWSIDLGRSVFRAYDEGGAEAGLPELDAGIQGIDLGRILTERDLTPQQIHKAYPKIEFRIHTDGTLIDALRAVTGTMRGPDHLFPLSPDWGVDPQWELKLQAVTHPGLRDHLCHLCRTENSARCDGAFYLGTRDPGFDPPRPVIAAWQFGEAQSWSAVIQLP